MCGSFGTTKMLIPNSLGQQLMNSISKGPNPNVNEKVYIFKSTILNILINFIPLLFVVCDDKDPPWFHKEIRALIQEKIIIVVMLI